MESASVGGGPANGTRQSIKQVATASFIGALLEWYDFFLYGTAAALVFGPLFFPGEGPLFGTLAAFATFGVGFFARPVGAIVFGHFGDKLGRKRMLLTTILLMGVGTFAIGLLPTYETIGVWAPVLLVLLRLVQGFALGGEWGGAALMLVEHAPARRRGFWQSWAQQGSPAGFVLGTGVLSAFSLLPDEQFLAWGWRVPFLLSIVVLGVGLYIRLNILETPAFADMKREGDEASIPVAELFRKHWREVLLTFGSRFAPSGGFNIFAVYAIAFATEEAGVNRTVVLNAILVASAIELLTIPVFASLSDRIGRRPIHMGASVFAVALAVPFFLLIGTGSTFAVFLAIGLAIAIASSAWNSVEGVFFAELFGTNVRYTGMSLPFQAGSIAAGALAPLIATALFAATGSILPVAGYVIVAGLISFTSVLFLPEGFRRDLSAVTGGRASRAGAPASAPPVAEAPPVRAESAEGKPAGTGERPPSTTEGG